MFQAKLGTRCTKLSLERIMKKFVIAFIIIVAAFLRLWGLPHGDPVSDEVYYAFRAIGMLDFDEADVQTTPLEWYDPSTSSGHVSSAGSPQAGSPSAPWWTRLSFHDHPPLVFAIQHFSIQLFGENNFAYRFPSAVFGIASVYLLYLIGRRLFSERAGALAAALLAVTVNHVYISRLAMQESFVIFFLLLASYCFLRALEEQKWFFAAGAALGLGLLFKYTVFIAAPIFLVYLAFFRRDLFRSKELLGGVFLAILIASPIFVYNIAMYRATGHFDFQISHILGNAPEMWRSAPGKDVGTLSERLTNFVPRLVNTNSWVFLLVVAASIAAFALQFARRPMETARRFGFLAFSLAFVALLLIGFIGTSFRFLTMLTPFFALAAACGFDALMYRRRTLGIAAFSLMLIFEIAYTVNNQLLFYPIGPEPWASSKVKEESFNWGYNELDAFLRNEFDGKFPALFLDAKYHFLQDIQERAVREAKERGDTPYPALIIYAGNFQQAAKLLILDRFQIYHGWPVVPIQEYVRNLALFGNDHYERAGFQNFYLILAANIDIEPDPFVRTLLEGKEFTSIRNKRGDEVFRVYRW